MTINWTARLIGALVAIGAVVLLITIGPAACTSLFTAKQEARLAKGQASAAADSGAEAMNTVSKVAASDAATDQIHKEGIDAIRSAPEGRRGDATVAAACRLRQYRDSERCAALRKSRAGEPAAAGPAR